MNKTTKHSAQALFFHNDQLVFNELTQCYLLPLDSVACEYHPDTHFYCGLHDDKPVYAVFIQPHTLIAQPTLQLIAVRTALINTNKPSLCHLMCRAKQLLFWHRKSLFCGQCGHRTQLIAQENCKRCEHCQTTNYPFAAPAIIVVIQREQEILLARSPRFATNMYSALAGFVEPGESCETTIAREVYEEVGLRVTNARYFGSQSWPFPNSFMIGFTADYAGGEINMNPIEIEDARWFTRDQLPPLPPPYSIARQLIEQVVNQL